MPLVAAEATSIKVPKLVHPINIEVPSKPFDTGSLNTRFKKDHLELNVYDLKISQLKITIETITFIFFYSSYELMTTICIAQATI